jgi:hypothetical protein
MAVDIVKADGGWILRSSDSGSSGGLTKGSGAGVSIPNAKDVVEFLTAIDKASSGKRYDFTRSDGVAMKAYPSEKRPGGIVIERAGGNWVRFGVNEASQLRMLLMRRTV